MYRLIILIILVSAVGGCRRAEQAESELSWPQVIWHVAYNPQTYIKAINVAPDQGFIVLMGMQPPVNPWPYLLRYSRDGVLLDSVLMTFPEKWHKSSLPPEMVYDKTDSGGIWIGYKDKGLNIDYFDSKLKRVQSIRDTSFKNSITAMEVTPTGIMLATRAWIAKDTIGCKLIQLDKSGNEISSISLPIDSSKDKFDNLEVKVEFIVPDNAGGYFLVGGVLAKHWLFSKQTYVAYVDSLGKVLWNERCCENNNIYVTTTAMLSNGNLLFSSFLSTGVSKGQPTFACATAEVSRDGEIVIREDIAKEIQGNRITVLLQTASGILALGQEGFRVPIFEGDINPLFYLSLNRDGIPQSHTFTGYPFAVADASIMADGTLLVAGCAHKCERSSIALIKR